ncbi:1-phosphatidylinositol-3-phosphate 5-kinase FAB1B [Capsicum annuum]|nr:1-phosphatidylinositol-3-phosphate 5-kinase FAB1B [Capsicum annuum]
MVYNGKSRHIRRRHNTVRELLSSGIITVDYVKTKDNVSDPLTKGLSRGSGKDIQGNGSSLGRQHSIVFRSPTTQSSAKNRGFRKNTGFVSVRCRTLLSSLGLGQVSMANVICGRSPGASPAQSQRRDVTFAKKEMDHLKMAVAKIDAHHPNILLVEKSVSRFAQEYLLAKDIALVLNVKRPLLERIARCTGAQVVPSIDNLTMPKLGYCESFHVDKFVEEHGSAGQAGKKMTKTLMFFEGCPKPFGCTILLKGANGDDLKKIKRVIQYGVFAAYHLALETSFLADEGASLPELPLKSPIKVALPDKPSTIQRSISIIPGFSQPVSQRPLDQHCPDTPSHSSTKLLSGITSPSNNAQTLVEQSNFPECSNSLANATTASNNVNFSDCPNSLHHSRLQFSDQADGTNEMAPNDPHEASPLDRGEVAVNDYMLKFPNNALRDAGSFSHVVESFRTAHLTSELVLPEFDNSYFEELESLKQEYPSSPSDQQIIVVCLSTRSVWKGTVCEPPHISRIKYYGITDMPLGRFLRDRLFDENFRCPSCEMPPEAHVRCYTHRQGSLTISVKKLPERILQGEREGKIWMWHRCLRCPRTNGFPPPTKRVVMSDAAWGLSFGKFLELSFSNHAAASGVASCGHLLHRDCLRFYGFGKMVACLRYAPVHVYSVFLPSPKLEFSYNNQEWIQKEGDEVHSRANALFAEVSRVLHVKLEKFSVDSSLKSAKISEQIAEMEDLLEKEKTEFEQRVGEERNDQGSLIRDNGRKMYRMDSALLSEEIYCLSGPLDDASELGSSDNMSDCDSPESGPRRDAELGKMPIIATWNLGAKRRFLEIDECHFGLRRDASCTEMAFVLQQKLKIAITSSPGVRFRRIWYRQKAY